ncbi:uncharacterized protein [Rutidosis leptorrhynchoides]|uniref:uncharacterized protein n=1 Tax=Rutidosis leptorrhynchoides TaxID=125765 RepID=UPI003A99E858
MTKHIWNLVSNKKSIWVKWIKEHKIGDRNFWSMDCETVEASSCWRGILRIKESIRSNIFHKLGDRRGTSIWYDHWNPNGPLYKFVTKRDILESGLTLKSTVNDIRDGNELRWPVVLLQKYSNILSYKPQFSIGNQDEVRWVSIDGKLADHSTSRAWLDMKVTRKDVKWHKLVWFSQNIPRNAFILWVATNQKLTTQDRLESWMVQDDKLCAFCNQVKDSHNHIFIDCQYAKDVWDHFRNKAALDDIIDIIINANISWVELIELMSNKKRNKSIWSIIRRLVIGSIIYHLWQERNARLFKSEQRNVDTLSKHIEEVVRLRLMGLNIVKSSHSTIAAAMWKFNVIEVNPQSQHDSTSF